MFNKTKTPKPEAQPVPIPDDLPDLTRGTTPVAAQAAPRTVPGKTTSLLSSDLTFEGNITGAGDLHIDGAVRGDVKVGRLTVGETGNVEGSVSGDFVEVRGRVVGSVSGKQVKLMGTAYVDGDITHEQLSIDVGAYFQGRCLQARKADQAAAPTPQQPVGFAAPSYSAPQPSPVPSPPPVAAPAPQPVQQQVAQAPAFAPAPVPQAAPQPVQHDTAQLIELKPGAA